MKKVTYNRYKQVEISESRHFKYKGFTLILYDLLSMHVFYSNIVTNAKYSFRCQTYYIYAHTYQRHKYCAHAKTKHCILPYTVYMFASFTQCILTPFFTLCMKAYIHTQMSILLSSSKAIENVPVNPAIHIMYFI